jgi:hypothetical protein
VDYFLPRASYNPTAETQTGNIYTKQHSNDRMTLITHVKTLIFYTVAFWVMTPYPGHKPRYMGWIRDKCLSSSQTMATGKLVCP